MISRLLLKYAAINTLNLSAISADYGFSLGRWQLTILKPLVMGVFETRTDAMEQSVFF